MPDTPDTPPTHAQRFCAAVAELRRIRRATGPIDSALANVTDELAQLAQIAICAEDMPSDDARRIAELEELLSIARAERANLGSGSALGAMQTSRAIRDRIETLECALSDAHNALREAGVVVTNAFFGE